MTIKRRTISWAPLAATVCMCIASCSAPEHDAPSLNRGAVKQAPPPVSVSRSPELTRVRLGLTVDRPLSDGQIIIQGAWGSGAGQFGKRDEASRPGPMSLAVSDDGAIHVLDQVNRRVQRFDRHGQLAGQTSIASEATEDIAIIGSSLYTLVYEQGDTPGYRVARQAEGQPAQQVPLARTIELVTGMFITGTAAAPSVWIEERHDQQVKVVSGGFPLQPDEQLTRVLGRPHRGQPGARLSATRQGRFKVMIIHVRPGKGAAPLLEVTAPLPIVAIHALSSDRAGNIYLGLLLGRDSADRGLTDVRRLMVVHRPGAPVRTVELSSHRITDVFRSTAVSASGDIHQLHTTEAGVTVRRWAAAPGGGVR